MKSMKPREKNRKGESVIMMPPERHQGIIFGVETGDSHRKMDLLYLDKDAVDKMW
jgi:hypothetical protein